MKAARRHSRSDRGNTFIPVDAKVESLPERVGGARTPKYSLMGQEPWTDTHWSSVTRVSRCSSRTPERSHDRHRACRSHASVRARPSGLRLSLSRDIPASRHARGHMAPHCRRPVLYDLRRSGGLLVHVFPCCHWAKRRGY